MYNLICNSTDVYIQTSPRIKVKFVAFLVASLLVFPNFDVKAAGLVETPYKTRITFEQVTLPQDEKLGLIGINVLGKQHKWAYYGAAAYGAVTGDRGGFFTGGFEAGINSNRKYPVQLEAGLFVGAGGGGAAPQGGGLMLRPHIGVMMDWHYGTVGLQYSNIKFPNGDISSKQFALQLDIASTMLSGHGWLDYHDLFKSFRLITRHSSLVDQTRSYKAIIKRYTPYDSTTRSGTPAQPHDVLGIEWNRYGQGNTFLRIETAGALGGESDGYAEVLTGLGYRFRLSEHGQLRAAFGLGAAGGGDVDTGGGFVTDGYIAYDHFISNALEIGGRVGYMTAPNGNFKASTIGLNLGFRFAVPTLSKSGNQANLIRSTYKPNHLRVRAVHQTYHARSGNLRKNGITNSSNVDLMGAKIDYMLSRHFYITGQALFAYDGDAGGYAAGLFGIGLHNDLWRNSRLSIDVEFNAGAAGGGGLAVGGGAIVQPMLGLNYRVTPSLGLGIGVSRLKAHSGNLDIPVLELSVNYRFTAISRALKHKE